MQLKPYVSYRVADVERPPFTAEELFGHVYAAKIRQDFEQGKLGPDNEPLQPSAEEALTAEEARSRATAISTDVV